MSRWSPTPPELREVIDRVCTPEEADVVRLYEQGCGYRRMASILGISRDTARNRFQRAIAKLRAEVELHEAE